MIVESILCYESEIWIISSEMKYQLKVVEMDYLRCSVKVSKQQSVKHKYLIYVMLEEKNYSDIHGMRGPEKYFIEQISIKKNS